MQSSVTVIGAGIFGVSSALELLDRGFDVTLVEQYDGLDLRTTSNAPSRNIRFSHGDDVWYTKSARKAKSLWKHLENRLSIDLMDECGFAWFAHTDDGWASVSQLTLEAQGIPVERLDPTDGERLYPSFGYDDLSFILFEVDAGVLRAGKAVSALRKEFVDSGGKMRLGKAERKGESVLIEGEIYNPDATIWCCGPWIPNLFDIPTDIKVTVQEVTFFNSSPEWDSPHVPAYSDAEDANNFYGVGGLEGFPFKLASDLRGVEFNPDLDQRELNDKQLNLCKDYLSKRFPSLQNSSVFERRLCQYTSTGDSNWIIAPISDISNQWIVGAGSGHGFKHGPALGVYVADLIEGKIKPDLKFAANERPFLTGGWQMMENRLEL